MSGGNTIRLVSGGTIQVRTGTLKESGPQGPQGATGATGPMPVFDSTITLTSLNWGSTPTGSVTGSGTSADKYKINLSIPTTAPVVASPATVTTNTGNTTVAISGSGTNASPLAFTFNIPAGQTGATGSSGTGYSSFNAIASLEIAVATSAAQGAAGTDLTFGSGNQSLLTTIKAAASGVGWTVSGTNVGTGKTTTKVNDTASTDTSVTPNLAGYSVRISANTTAAVASGTVITFVAPTTNDSSSAPAGATNDTTTSEQGFPIPKIDTKPYLPYFFKVLVQALDKYVVARFADSTTRGTKRTSPVAGEMSFLSDTNALYVYGDAYRPIAQVRYGTTDPSGTAPEGTIYIRY